MRSRKRRRRRYSNRVSVEHNRNGFFSRLGCRLGRLRARVMVFGAAAAALMAAVALIVFLPGDTDSVSLRGGEAALANAVQGLPMPSAQPSAQPVPSETPTPTPSPVSTPKPTPTPDPTLQKGDENERVQQLQERLMDLGYLDVDETTLFFGPATKYAVELFQRQHTLQQDGIAGPETLQLIYSKDARKYTLLEGTKGQDVDSLQRQLVDLGYMDKTTGYYGDETVKAVKDFQERNGLKVDGKTGQYTLDLIYSPEAKASASKVQAEKRRANIRKMIQVAKDQLGKPYVLGNQGPRSFDCSGLVYYCLKQAGSSRGRYNAAGYARVSDWKKISSMSDLETGDLLFFWNNARTKIGHVGIYVGGGMMIDASSANGKVVHRSCTTPYWKRMFEHARRPW